MGNLILAIDDWTLSPSLRVDNRFLQRTRVERAHSQRESLKRSRSTALCIREYGEMKRHEEIDMAESAGLARRQPT
jgi:hypothetical protein